MMSQFPARDVEQPVTKEHLSIEVAALRLEFHTELHDDLGGLRTAVGTEINGLRGERRQQLSWVIGTQLVVLAVLASLIIALH